MIDSLQEKACTVCEQVLPLTKFYRHKRTRDGLAHVCKDCHYKETNAHRIANKDRWRRYARQNYLKFQYGINTATYDRMLAAQHGGCAICGATKRGGNGANLHVDHDHVTGRVRGLLCSHCNRGLGIFQDDVALLHKAIAYLTYAH